MIELKGHGRSLLHARRNGILLSLVAYADESLSICRDGKALCTWEAWESQDGTQAFLKMLGSLPPLAASPLTTPGLDTTRAEPLSTKPFPAPTTPRGDLGRGRSKYARYVSRW